MAVKRQTPNVKRQTPNSKLQTPNAIRNSPQSRCPTNSIHNRLAETYFRHWLDENPLDVQLIHLSE
jgi:hypothetical protein